jgi:hypothetical protein
LVLNRRKQLPLGNFTNNHPDMIVQDIIPDIVLFIKFKSKRPRFRRPKDKRLSLGISAPGIISNTRTGTEFPQIYPSGSPERYLYSLPYNDADNSGIFNLPIGGRRRRGNGRLTSRKTGDGGRWKRKRLPGDSG